MTEEFKAAGTRAFYRTQGTIAAGQLVDRITLILERSRLLGVREILVNICGATGFDSPGPAFRRWAVGRWAGIGAGLIRIAMVARQELICPEKTGLLAAAEESLQAHICTTEAEAFQWLDAEPIAEPFDSRLAKS